jgi:hypothetical protein
MNELTPWGTVLLEKLIVFLLIKKFPMLYASRMLISLFVRALYPILNHLSPIHICIPYFFKIQFMKLKILR